MAVNDRDRSYAAGTIFLLQKSKCNREIMLDSHYINPNTWRRTVIYIFLSGYFVLFRRHTDNEWN